MRLGFGKPEDHPDFTGMKYRVALPEHVRRSVSGRSDTWKKMKLWFVERGQGSVLIGRDTAYFDHETTALAFDLRWVYEPLEDISARRYYSHGEAPPVIDPEEEKAQSKIRRANLERLIREKRWPI